MRCACKKFFFLFFCAFFTLMLSTPFNHVTPSPEARLLRGGGHARNTSIARGCEMRTYRRTQASNSAKSRSLGPSLDNRLPDAFPRPSASPRRTTRICTCSTRTGAPRVCSSRTSRAPRPTPNDAHSWHPRGPRAGRASATASRGTPSSTSAPSRRCRRRCGWATTTRGWRWMT